MVKFRSYVYLFLSGILAGLLIGLGGAVNLQLSSMGQPVFGGIFFSVGLMSICLLEQNLFTGKVGYLFEKKPSFLLDLLFMCLGNVVGAMTVGYICGLAIPGWTVALEPKFVYGEGSNFLYSFLRAVGAGMFVYLAVECYKRIPSYPAKLLMVMLPIATMVILGCNHSIANVFYFAYAQIRVENFDAINAILSVLVALLGNAIGSLILYGLQYGAKSLLPKQA
ncbi:MAG: formate/nitrite transporter family protein [Bacilli bacterium]|nr:formate/nitrite transporter family protein [Bacilli bacterium]